MEQVVRERRKVADVACAQIDVGGAKDRSVLSAWCEATVIVCGRACIRVQPYSLGWMKLMPATLV